MKIKLLLFFLVFLAFNNFAQNVTISGYIQDFESGEHLIGANVFDASNMKYGTATNSYGFYSLTLPKGVHKLSFTYIGYGVWQKEVTVTKDTVINAYLSSDITIDEVIVTATHNQVESSQMSRIDVSIETIKTLPALFGEVDILKSLQLLPGVQGGTEGSSGIFVRGGGPDQNLILVDGVPVYNVNHLFGFFSVFNSDAVSNVTLFKGGFPARYGGRLSSVIDISLKEGNMKKFQANVSVGIIASKFTIEGPIIKNRTSFIVSARRTYIDVLAAPFIKLAQVSNGQGGDFTGGYYFYDFNAKINHKFSEKDRLFFSLYGGEDKAYFRMTQSDDASEAYYKMSTELGWGNLISALRWNHVISQKLFMNTTLTYSKFNFFTDMGFEQKIIEQQIELLSEYGVAYNSGIDDWAAKIDFDYAPNVNHIIKFGINGIYHTFHPGETEMYFHYGTFGLDTIVGDIKLNAQEYSAYLEDDIKLGSKVKINIGGRLSLFQVRDTIYFSPEPRGSIRIMITKGWSIKASYAEMKQYLHFLTNNTVGMPTDLWLPATDRVVPQKSVQYAVGTSIDITPKLSLVIEGFYKEMTNLVDLKEGASIFGNFESGQSMGSIWESKVESGIGWAYGGEILLKKDVGKFTGWIGYTLGWTNRKFETIAFGEIYPYRYDRRHDISVVGIYNFNKNVNMSVTWVYGSGTPITLAQMQYLPIDGAFNFENLYDYNRIQYYGKRNNYRLPAYHRLDIGLNWSKEIKIGVRTWSFSVYNAYNQINPFFTELDRYSTEGNPKLMIYSIFPIIPSVSYKLEF